MATEFNKIRLRRLLRENLGLVAAAGAESEVNVVTNEKPVKPVTPKPSVDGSEVGSVKSQPAFETNATMRSIGKLLSKLTDNQQKSIYKRLRSSTKKKSTNEVTQLKNFIKALIVEGENPEAARRRAISMSKLAQEIQSGEVSDADAIQQLTQQHEQSKVEAQLWLSQVKQGRGPAAATGNKKGRDPSSLGMPKDVDDRNWKPSNWNKFKMGSHHPKPGDDDTSHMSGEWGGPSDEDLDAIDQGAEGTGDYKPEAVDDDIAQQIPGEFQRRAKLTAKELKAVDLTDRSLRVGRDALEVGEVIDAISAQVGVSRSAVTNVLYDYMKKVGDAQIRRRPSERRAIPTSSDQEKMGTARAVETMLYDDFIEEMEGYGDMFPELAENPYPEAISDLPQNDYRRELFRNYARLFLMSQYGDDIRSSVDLMASWHNLADVTGNPPREHGNGKQHSETNSLHGFIVGDVRELMGNMNSADFEQYLKRAQSLIDTNKTAGGQGWKGVVKKVDKEAEKVAKKKAKAKAKAAKAIKKK